MHTNTAISTLMIYVNEATRLSVFPDSHKPVLAQLLSPLAPHLAEEFWQHLGNSTSVAHAEWPSYDEALTMDNEIEIPVQINGKVRAVIAVPVGAEESAVLAVAKAHEAVQRNLEGMQVVKVIFRTDKMLNLVIKPA
jgi:leucyl-tRNA synthetase